MSSFDGVEDPSPALCFMVVLPFLAAGAATSAGVLIMVARALAAMA